MIFTMMLAVAAQAAPLAATGKWAVDFADRMCVAYRDHGTGDETVTLAFKPVPLGDVLEIVLIGPARRGGSLTSGEGQLILRPSGETLLGKYSRRPFQDRDKQVTMLTIFSPPLTAIAQAATFEFRIGSRAPIVLAPRATGAALKTLDACETDLLTGWGVDPKQSERIATAAKPIGSPNNWVTITDYPNEALRRGQGGTVELLFRVAADGSIGECRNLRGSGSEAIDATPCRLLEKRGKYTPATGLDGAPIVSHKVVRFTFFAG